MPGIPQSVLDTVQRQVCTLSVLSAARKTDDRFEGKGRYEWEVYQERYARIQEAYATLAKVSAVARKNGVEMEEIYALTGNPAFLSDRARNYGNP